MPTTLLPLLSGTADCVPLATIQHFSFWFVQADTHAFLSSSSDVVTACDTARNQSLMLIGFDSGRLAMFRIAFKTSTSPVMRRKLVQKSGFASETDSGELRRLVLFFPVHRY